MTERIEIQGGADEFEAAVVAVVIDRIAREEASARQVGGRVPREAIPAWVRAVHYEDPSQPREIVRPD